MSDNSRGSSFMAQAFILAAAAIITRVMGFLYKLPIINMIGDEGIGIYGMGGVVYNFFYILSSAGLPAAVSRMVSARLALKQNGNAHEVFKVSLKFALIIGLISSLVLFFGAGFFSSLINSPDAYYSLIALAPTVLITSVLSSFRGYFQGMGNTIPTAISQIIEQIFNAVFSILLVYVLMKRTDDISIAAGGGNAGTGIWALIGLLSIMLIYAMARGRIFRKIKRRKSYAEYESKSAILKEILRTAFPIIAGTAIFSFTGIIDSLMVISRIQVGGFSYNEALAFFGLLSNKFNALTTLPVAIASTMATAVIPNISASVALKDHASVGEKTNLALRLAMIICVPASFGMGIFADQIYKLIFPGAPAGGYLLAFGFPTIIFLSLYQISTGILQGIGQVKVPVMSALVGCLIKIPVNYVLLSIPQLNILGAVFGTFVCYAVAAPINVFLAYRYTGAKIDFKGIFVKPLFASIFMSGICYVSYYLIYSLYPSNAIALIISIFVGIVAYGLAMLMINGLGERELRAIPLGSKLIGFKAWLFGEGM